MQQNSRRLKRIGDRLPQPIYLIRLLPQLLDQPPRLVLERLRRRLRHLLHLPLKRLRQPLPLPRLDEYDREYKHKHVQPEHRQLPIRTRAPDLVAPYLLFVVPVQDDAHELGELALDLVFGVLCGFLGAVLCLLEEVVLSDESGESADVVVCPGGLALEEIVDLSLGFGALVHGMVIRDFGLLGCFTCSRDTSLCIEFSKYKCRDDMGTCLAMRRLVLVPQFPGIL